MERQAELELVAELRSGSEQAFDRIYEQFRPRLYGYLVRLSKHQAVAEDLLQETWIRLATRAPGLAEDTRLAAWLFTVARNLFLSYRRWRLLDTTRVQELARVEVRGEEPDCPFEALAANELERDLERALASLPLAYREVLLLTGLEGMTHQQAAEICELKPEALRKRLSRARNLLADRLAGRTRSTRLSMAPASSEARS